VNNQDIPFLSINPFPQHVRALLVAVPASRSQSDAYQSFPAVKSDRARIVLGPLRSDSSLDRPDRNILRLETEGSVDLEETLVDDHNLWDKILLWYRHSESGVKEGVVGVTMT